MPALRPLAAAVVPLLACGGDPAEPIRFAAAVADDEGAVSIGLTAQDGLVAGYACGDDPALERYPGWFVGETDGDQVSLELDGWTFAARFSPDGAEGTLREPSGAEVAWSAPPAAGLSGTYAARDAGCTTGVVVVDGRPPILRGVWCNSDGEQRQVTPLPPVQLVDGRLAVTVELASGARVLEVAPVELPLPGDR